MGEETKVHFGDTALGWSIGIAILAIACCLGVGSCNAIQAIGTRHRNQEAEEVSKGSKSQTEAVAGGFMTTIETE